MSLVRSTLHCTPLLLAVFISACTDDPESAADGGSAAPLAEDAGAPDTGAPLPTQKLSDLHGEFHITFLAPEPGSDDLPLTEFAVKPVDGPLPSPMKWLESMRSGDCALYEPTAPFCEPKCAGGHVCVSDGECVAEPDTADIGTVTLDGLGDTPITAKLIVLDHQLPAGTKLPYPPCAPGDELTVTATGGDYPEFSMVAVCMSPLELTQQSVTVDKGLAVNLKWTKPDPAAETRMHVDLDISSHAGSYGKIVCETADDGSLDIAESLITRLMELGYAGNPTVNLTRESVGHPVEEEPSNVNYSVISSVALPVVIPGLISCLEQADCPDGLTCQWDKQCT